MGKNKLCCKNKKKNKNNNDNKDDDDDDDDDGGGGGDGDGNINNNNNNNNKHKHKHKNKNKKNTHKNVTERCVERWLQAAVWQEHHTVLCTCAHPQSTWTTPTLTLLYIALMASPVCEALQCPHKMTLVKCPCAFRLRRLAQNGVPGGVPGRFFCKFPYKMALVPCQCAFRPAFRLRRLAQNGVRGGCPRSFFL